jgi:hypothetical protein
MRKALPLLSNRGVPSGGNLVQALDRDIANAWITSF